VTVAHGGAGERQQREQMPGVARRGEEDPHPPTDRIGGCGIPGSAQLDDHLDVVLLALDQTSGRSQAPSS
jgi:hypothetical protein